MGSFDYYFFDKSRKEFLFVDATVNAGILLISSVYYWYEFYIDLSSLFHWNTKELFLYLLLEYDGKTHVLLRHYYYLSYAIIYCL